MNHYWLILTCRKSRISMKYIHWVHLDVNLQYNLAKTIIFLVNIMFNCILEYNTKKFFARFSSFVIKNENIRICQVVICLKRHLGNQTTRWLILKVYAACPLSTIMQLGNSFLVISGVIGGQLSITLVFASLNFDFAWSSFCWLLWLLQFWK